MSAFPNEQQIPAQTDAILNKVIDEYFLPTKSPSTADQSFFQRNKPLIKGVVGISLGAMGGAYCALVLASVINGALAISTTLATAGLALAALLLIAGIAALVKHFSQPKQDSLNTLTPA